MENWKKLTGYTNDYEVSDCGNVAKIVNGERVMLRQGNNQGYRYVNIGKPSVTKFVHRLVWEAFNGQIPKKWQIDHLDFDRANNRLENLRCVPAAINSARHSLEALKKTQRPVYMIDPETDEIVTRFDSMSEAARYAGVNPATIWQVCNRITNTAADWKWKYATRG